jgi:hypothetical protein
MHTRAVPPGEPGFAGFVLALDEVIAAASVSSSTVSIRFLVSGPVFSLVWVPSSLALVLSTPRGPHCSRKVLPLGRT